MTTNSLDNIDIISAGDSLQSILDVIEMIDNGTISVACMPSGCELDFDKFTAGIYSAQAILSDIVEVAKAAADAPDQLNESNWDTE